MEKTTQFYFDKQLSFCLQHQRYQDCPYYPCHHMTEQNCFFCYCPFFPCKDETKGCWLITEKERTWDCSACTWVHQDKIVKTILTLIYENKTIQDTRTYLVQENLW